MATLTDQKQNFYEFKNKVDLTNREVFGLLPSGNVINNELYVFLNKDLFKNGVKTYDDKAVKYKSNSITNYNLGIDAEENEDMASEYLQYLFKDINNKFSHHIFYDTSIFDNKLQPTLTEYFEYRGDIFELFERTNQITSPKIDREQKVKKDHLYWFDTDYLHEQIGIGRISKYIFNPGKFTDVFNNYYANSKYLIMTPGEYFLINTENKLNKEMYLTSNSNSIRPSRIYYKKIETQTGDESYENKFIYPYYLGGEIDLSSVGENIIETAGNDIILNGPGNIKKGNIID